jgi:hypothetical protein
MFPCKRKNHPHIENGLAESNSDGPKTIAVESDRAEPFSVLLQPAA